MVAMNSLSLVEAVTAERSGAEADLSLANDQGYKLLASLLLVIGIVFYRLFIGDL